jgi:hypothetical protein
VFQYQIKSETDGHVHVVPERQIADLQARPVAAARHTWGDNMQKVKRSTPFCAIGFLICGTLVTACSQTPPEPAPEFTLPLSQVSTQPPSPEESIATASAPQRLRYIAVPPGQHVAGMAHARIVVKQKRATRHHHARKRAVEPVAGTKPTAEPAAKP